MDGLTSGKARQSDRSPVAFIPGFSFDDAIDGPWTVVSVDGRAMPGPNHAFHELATALGFPEYFGHNWDALIDCLGEVGRWLQTKSVLVLINNGDALLVAEHLPILVDALCLGSERAGAESDADGIPVSRQAAQLCFVFDVSASNLKEIRARISRIGRRMELTPTGLSVW